MPRSKIVVPGLPKPPQWGQSDDAKLLNLFRRGPRNGGVDSENTHYKYIQQHVLTPHFPERINDYNNFAAVYRSKAAKFELEKKLAGARAGKLTF